MKILKEPSEYGIVCANNICLFQRSPLSQWWVGHAGQNSTFTPKSANSFDDETESFNCCEQFMMAAKASLMNDPETLKKIMKAKSPKKQKELGREIKNFKPDLWNLHKRYVVYVANYWKFSQNEELKKFLLSFPRGTIFAEAAPWDPVWGIGLGPKDPAALDVSKWKGENLLGEALQRVHQDLSYGPSKTGEMPY